MLQQSILSNPRVRAAIGAGAVTLLVAGAIVAAALVFTPSAAAAPIAIYAVSANDALVMEVEDAQLGERHTREKDGAQSEDLRWQRINAAKPAMVDDAPVLLARGETTLGAVTEIRLRFSDVAWHGGETLETLRLSDAELHLRLPAAGNPGDALLLVFDAKASIATEGGYLTFRPIVLQSTWTPDAAHSGTAPTAPPRVTPPPPVDPSLRPTPVVTQPVQNGPGDAAPPAPNVGRVHIAFAGEALGLVDRLDVRLTKFGVSPREDADQVMTRFAGSKWIDLVEAGTEGQDILRVQVQAAEYGGAHFEFDAAHTWLVLGTEHDTAVPQPGLAVFVPFAVERGGDTRITFTFGIEESILIGPDGLEFRPIITSVMVEQLDDEDDAEGDLLDRYPPQYRSGSWLPGLGETEDEALRGMGIDREVFRDPRSLRPDEVDEDSLAAIDAEEELDALQGTLEGITGKM